MFGTWIGRIVKTYDYINRVVITFPLTVYEGTWTNTLPCCCYAITMILRVRRNFFEITTFPNNETSHKYFAYKTKENSSASEHVLRMSQYYNHLNQVGVNLPDKIVIDRVL